MQKTKNRNAIVAGLFNVISPGLGFLYVGRILYALIFPLSLILLVAVASWTKLIFIPVGLFICMLVCFALWVGSIILAVLIARRQGEMILSKTQRWYVYVGFFIISSVIGNMLVTNRGKLFGYESFRFPSKSMANTLLFGDFLISNTWKYQSKSPQRGELIVFLLPDNPSIKYVKRVIALPGDTVEIKDGRVYVNAKQLTELYVEPENNQHMSKKNAIFAVPPGGYFVMGDNRDNSNDSRFWGAVPKQNVYGSVEFIWFSFDPILGFQSDRFGKLVD